MNNANNQNLKGDAINPEQKGIDLSQTKLTLDNVYKASYKVKEVIRHTDLIPVDAIFPEEKIYIKTENLQKTGSFKIRGAYYKISCLSEAEKANGVVACSAGNHAQGVALACQKLGIKSTIFMPESAPISKIEATKAYGSEIILAGDDYDSAYHAALEYNKLKKKTFIHPFNDPEVIVGQGTIGLEILEQLPDVDTVVVPIGGGGLISGVSYVIKNLKPDCEIIGVQAAKAPSMYESIKQNKIVHTGDENTFADGINVKESGDLTFQIVQQYVDHIVTVSEDEIAYSLLALMEKQKVVCEGAGAVAFAAVLFDKFRHKNKKVCVLLSGGNIDVNILSRVIQRGLLVGGRNTELNIALTDKPGQLQYVSTVIAELGANVTEVNYNPGGENTAIDSCVLNLKLETKNLNHIKDIKKALIEKGFHLVNEL
ncbi:MAG: threonine ammonia-lyase [Clostridiaceae bacterium]|nr:threonine ammonia-lyase [Clostridiaceae bacterium]